MFEEALQWWFPFEKSTKSVAFNKPLNDQMKIGIKCRNKTILWIIYQCIRILSVFDFVCSILMADGGIHDNSTFLSINFPNLIFLNVLFTGDLLMFSFFFSGKVDKLFFLIVLCEKCSLLWKNIFYLSRKNKKTFSIKEE